MAETRGGVSPTNFMGRSTENDAMTLRVLTSNQASLDAINIQLVRISTQMNGFNNSLMRISTLMAESSSLERQKERQEENRERILAEQKLREGKESIVERKIQNSLSAPVQKIGAKAQGSLSNLMKFFTFLLTGWLLSQTIQAFKAYSENNKKRLQDISKTILKGLGIAGAVFAALKIGLGTIISKVQSAASIIRKAVNGDLFKRPITGLIDAVKGAFRSVKNKVTGKSSNPPAKPAPASSTPSSSPGGGGFSPAAVAGGVGTSILNFAQGNSIQESLAGGAGVAALAYGASKLLPMPLGAAAFFLGAPTVNNAAMNLYKNISQNNFQFNMPKFGIDTSNSMSMGNMLSSDNGDPHTTDMKLSVANVSSLPSDGTTTNSIGPEPKKQTQVVVTDASAAGQNQESVPSRVGSAAELPNIASSNVSNFYVLYSQTQYNVVV